MNIFLIAPVRGISENYRDGVAAQVAQLEALGNEVYWPMRDTTQQDPTGYRICQDNLAAIKAADAVFVMWDGNSQGCLFDLGMTFALGKPVRGIDLPRMSRHKSFQNMVYDWEERGQAMNWGE